MSFDVVELSLSLIMSKFASLDLRRECVLVLIAILFDANVSAQKRVYKFVTTSGNEFFLIVLKEMIIDSFEYI